MEKNTDNEIRSAWKSLIVTQNPSYWVTITFNRPVCDSEAIASIKFFLKALFKCLPRRFKSSLKFVVGAERTGRPKFAGSYHFHILVCGLDDRLVSPLEWLGNSVLKCASAIKNILGKPLCGPKNIDFGRIRDLDAVANYMVKYVRAGHDCAGKNLWFIDSNGSAGALSDYIS